LTAKDVGNFTAALEALRDAGLARVNDTSELGQNARAWAANHDTKEILEQHDLSPERFQQIAYSVGMAMAALDVKSRQAEIAAARVKQQEALEKLKAPVTPEQYEVIHKQFEAANHALEQIQDQPAENLRLVAENRQAIENAIRN